MSGENKIYENVYLVTGGSGLVGSALQFAVNKYAVPTDKWIFLSSKNGNLAEKGVFKELCETHKPTGIVHLAARVGGLFDNLNNNLEYLNQNLLINMNVLNTCNESPIVKKVLSCMSTCIFPDKCSLPLEVENLHSGLPHHSNLGYSYAKRLLDVQNRILWSADKPFLGVIPTNIFGPFDNFNLDRAHVIPALINKCFIAKMTGKPFTVKGSGNAKRQFLYSIDFARVILMMMNEHYDNSQEPLIIAPDEEYTIRELAEKIAKIMGYDGEILFTTLAQEGQDKKTANGSNIKNKLCGFKFTDFDSALQETIVWFIKAKYNNDNIRE